MLLLTYVPTVEESSARGERTRYPGTSHEGAKAKRRLFTRKFLNMVLQWKEKVI